MNYEPRYLKALKVHVADMMRAVECFIARREQTEPHVSLDELVMVVAATDVPNSLVALQLVDLVLEVDAHYHGAGMQSPPSHGVPLSCRTLGLNHTCVPHTLVRERRTARLREQIHRSLHGSVAVIS